jgi:hypothetical protein
VAWHIHCTVAKALAGDTVLDSKRSAAVNYSIGSAADKAALAATFQRIQLFINL